MKSPRDRSLEDEDRPRQRAVTRSHSPRFLILISVERVRIFRGLDAVESGVIRPPPDR